MRSGTGGNAGEDESSLRMPQAWSSMLAGTQSFPTTVPNGQAVMLKGLQDVSLTPCIEHSPGMTSTLPAISLRNGHA